LGAAIHEEWEVGMSETFSTPGSRTRSYLFFGICAILAIISIAIGIDDNPPGLLLAYLAGISLILAFVHPWRIARKFIYLLLASALGMVLFIILNIITDAIVQNPGASAALQDLIQSPAFEVINTVIVIIFPAAFLVAAVGAVVAFIRSRRQTE
jgi:hypothetical protein